MAVATDARARDRASAHDRSAVSLRPKNCRFREFAFRDVAVAELAIDDEDGRLRRPERETFLAAIVKATTFYDDPDVLAKVSRGLGEAMVGINVEDIAQPHRLAERGW